MKKGDTVRLSAEGLLIFRRRSKKDDRPEDRRGKVLNAGHDAPKPLPDGCVRVWWDHRSEPETIARHFLESIEEAGV